MSATSSLRPLLLLALGTVLVVVGAGSGYAPVSGRGPRGGQTATDCSEGLIQERPAPSLGLRNLDGGAADLRDLRGQVVVLNLWASWCPPCRAEMPDLQAWYEANRDAGLVVVGVNIGETEAQVREVSAALGLTFPIWMDPDETSLRAFETVSLPATYAIDRSGRVRVVWLGPVCREALETRVAPLLAE